MNTSELNDDRSTVEKISICKTILFSTGYFLNTYLLIAFNNYVWTFYEGELGFINIVSSWPFYMAIANTIYTIWSMITNPFIGYLTDRPFRWTKRWGFHTPWVVIAGLPSILFFFLLFTPPITSGPLFVFIYYIIIVSLYDFFYSLLITHSYGAFPVHFRGDQARRKGGLATQIFTFLANFLAVTIFSQTINPGVPMTFTFAAFVSIVIMIISYFLFIPGSKESAVIKERFICAYINVEKSSFLQAMKMSLKEKNFLLVIFSYLAFMIAFGLTSMNSVNFVDDVLEEQQYIRSIGSILMLISSFITMPIWIRVAKRIGHSNTYAIGLASFGVSLLLYLFITDAFQFYLLNIAVGISGALYLVMLSPVTADCYDEIAVKTKKHHETTLLGVRNVFVRIAIPIQSFIIAMVHAINHYDPNEISYNIDTIIGLRIIQGVIPFIISIIAALIFYRFYDLKGQKKVDVNKKLIELNL